MYFIDAEYETLSPICKLIYDGNILQAIELANQGEDLNASDENGNAALHYSVMADSEHLLQCLLKQANVNVDVKNQDGETAFLMSIKMRRSSSFIQRFIDAGCDLNTQNDVQEIALHLAVAYSLNDTVLKLLEKGADVNITDSCNQTALHSAVECRNLEGGCMLLCYGADVSITEHNHMTVFMFALNDCFNDMAVVLFNYCSDFSDVSTFGETPLLIATKVRSGLALDIVRTGADVNCLTPNGTSPLQYSLQYKDAELFKLIWDKVDCVQLTATSTPLLYSFVKNCLFSNDQWLECLYLIVNSSHITDLITHVTSVGGGVFLTTLVMSLCKRNIDIMHKTNLIYLFLSLGITELMNFSDVFSYYLRN